MSDRQLLGVLRAQFALDWKGIHGAGHWARVRRNGLRLAATTGASPRVVTLFAWLHDSRRLDDGRDPMHGPRAADLARMLRGHLFDLADADFERLVRACAGHTAGRWDEDVTVRTCWDADRLDLGRVGIMPDPAYLCTDAARDPAMIQWAYRRSLRGRPSAEWVL